MSANASAPAPTPFEVPNSTEAADSSQHANASPDVAEAKYEEEEAVQVDGIAVAESKQQRREQSKAKRFRSKQRKQYLERDVENLHKQLKELQAQLRRSKQQCEQQQLQLASTDPTIIDVHLVKHHYKQLQKFLNTLVGDEQCTAADWEEMAESNMMLMMPALLPAAELTAAERNSRQKVDVFMGYADVLTRGKRQLASPDDTVVMGTASAAAAQSASYTVRIYRGMQAYMNQESTHVACSSSSSSGARGNEICVPCNFGKSLCGKPVPGHIISTLSSSRRLQQVTMQYNISDMAALMATLEVKQLLADFSKGLHCLCL
jgi:hypothetical protein